MLSMDPVFASHVRLPVSPLLRQQPGVAAPLSRPNLACHAAPNRISIPPRSVALRLTTRYGRRCLPSYFVLEDPRLHILSKVLARVLRTPYRCYYGSLVVLYRLNFHATLFNAIGSLARPNLPVSSVSPRSYSSPRWSIIPNRFLGT